MMTGNSSFYCYPFDTSSETTASCSRHYVAGDANGQFICVSLARVTWQFIGYLSQNYKLWSNKSQTIYPKLQFPREPLKDW